MQILNMNKYMSRILIDVQLHWSTKFNFFLAREEKYLILIELLTLNSNV